MLIKGDIIRPFSLLVLQMKLSKRLEEGTINPFRGLNQVADGYIVVGYLKDTHEQFAQFYSTDQACNDALAFFHGPVNEWMQLLKSEELQDGN